MYVIIAFVKKIYMKIIYILTYINIYVNIYIYISSQSSEIHYKVEKSKPWPSKRSRDNWVYRLNRESMVFIVFSRDSWGL